MKPTQKIKPNKAKLDLPAQRVWKALEAYEMGKGNTKKVNKPKEMERLLDQAFELLLDRLIRRN